MAANTKPRQLGEATGATDTTGDPRKIGSPSDSRHPAPLRRDLGTCRACARPLEDAALVRRAWRLIRSGEHIGGTGEFRTYRCPCGECRCLLHTVWMPPCRGRAA